MRSIVLLGSTGSIGTQTLDVVRNNKDELKVVGLAANKRVNEVEQQVREFNPKYVCMFDQEAAKELQEKIADTGIKVMSGMDGLLEMVSVPEADTVLTAVVGMIGIRPTIKAIESGKDIALANKETLVCAGHIIMPLAKEKKVQILPVDSEHSAIFQSLVGQPKDKVEKILLTASGHHHEDHACHDSYPFHRYAVWLIVRCIFQIIHLLEHLNLVDGALQTRGILAVDVTQEVIHVDDAVREFGLGGLAHLLAQGDDFLILCHELAITVDGFVLLHLFQTVVKQEDFALVLGCLALQLHLGLIVVVGVQGADVPCQAGADHAIP